MENANTKNTALQRFGHVLGWVGNSVGGLIVIGALLTFSWGMWNALYPNVSVLVYEIEKTSSWIIIINGKAIEVDSSFLSRSIEDRNAAFEEISKEVMGLAYSSHPKPANIVIRMPNGDEVAFPYNMSNETIRSNIASKFPKFVADIETEGKATSLYYVIGSSSFDQQNDALRAFQQRFGNTEGGSLQIPIRAYGDWSVLYAPNFTEEKLHKQRVELNIEM